ncbi:regulatory protein ToxS [Shewanella sp. YLB-07]|uniref:regulatory protein ToxS n=1 Tax=Shewanella sp. YLB-07 TaxID=2601268 RepID=UPI00128AF039|nr:regulatory protein ToxS [Shewanella sp. YLB-07]MPY22448.1 hypothetical protein [Shewanella sp. YLB-07]
MSYFLKNMNYLFIFSVCFFSVFFGLTYGTGYGNSNAFLEGRWEFHEEVYINNNSAMLGRFEGDVTANFDGELEFHSDNDYSTIIHIQFLELDTNEEVIFKYNINSNGRWEVNGNVLNFMPEDISELKPVIAGTDNEFILNLAENVIKRAFSDNQIIYWIDDKTFLLNNLNHVQTIFNGK